MVRRLRLAAAAAFAALALASCEYLSVTPFPGFVDKTDSSIDLGKRIDGIVGSEKSIKYDLQVVIGRTGQSPRLLLLVEPPSSGGSSGFEYKGQLIFLDKDLNVLGQAPTASSFDYFTKPYSYTADGNILAGYTILTPGGGASSISISAHGLEGFAFTNGAETYLFATPSGKYAAFDLAWRYYLFGWGIGPPGGTQTLKILPDGERPSSSDPNYANLGYQLVALSYNSSNTEITFVFSEPSAGRIVAARMLLADATNVSGPPLMSSASAWPISLNVDRPAVFADLKGLYLVRRDGWMEHYPWTESGTLALAGGSEKIVGDRSLTRNYAFLEPELASDPSYMYRFDPASRILTRYGAWW